MSGNANSVRFKFACNVHDWTCFEKLSFSGKTDFYIKLPMVMVGHFLYQIACSHGLQGYFQMMQKKQTFRVVVGRLNMGIKLWVVNTAIYGK